MLSLLHDVIGTLTAALEITSGEGSKVSRIPSAHLRSYLGFRLISPQHRSHSNLSGVYSPYEYQLFQQFVVSAFNRVRNFPGAFQIRHSSSLLISFSFNGGNDDVVRNAHCHAMTFRAMMVG
jgi:hypothetical protein